MSRSGLAEQALRPCPSHTQHNTDDLYPADVSDPADAATEEACLWPRQLPLEEDTAVTTLLPTLDHRSTVRPSDQKALAREKMDALAQGRAGHGQGIAEDFRVVLSQWREFLGKEDSRVGSAVLQEGPWVSTSSGQKGRQVVEGDGLVDSVRCLPQ